MKLKEIYQELKQSLLNEEAQIEARIILQNVLNIDNSELITNEEQELTRNQIKTIFEIRDKRNKEKIPLAYLLEEAVFCGHRFFVNSDVLIPRPETELLVTKILEEIKSRRISKPTILDLGTGSGCIANSLKLALPAARVLASDISRASLNVAYINAKRLKAEIEFIMGDFLDPILGVSSSPIAVPVMTGKPPYFDIIVSNPPYISEADYQNLAAELFHEPKHALVGFPYAHIKNQAKGLLYPNGFMAFEFGLGQSDKLLEIFPKAKIYPDLAGIDRVLVV
ncbi:MAG: peptide chain release factor N(5)-glutamine methyltransferase [Candidatus Caenarcaniphilales bacterium]|nr:peptide chain release factor N(5)-glutamine methyltransferase [Candidatus Caenarcaniphilales bacterium]